MHGVANDTSLIRGAEMFGDIIADPEAGKHLLDYCHGIILAISRFNGGICYMANCCVMMVSPEIYVLVFMPYDRVACALA